MVALQERVDRNLEELRAYSERIARHRFGLDPQAAEDTSQDVILAAWRKLGDQEIHPGWVAQATRFECLKRLRGRVRRIQRETEYGRLFETVESPRTEQREVVLSVLEGLLGHLPSDLLDRSGGSLVGVARTCGVPPGTLYRRIWQARRKKKLS